MVGPSPVEILFMHNSSFFDFEHAFNSRFGFGRFFYRQVVLVGKIFLAILLEYLVRIVINIHEILVDKLVFID